MQSWKLHEAKARMSELIKRAQEQPQDLRLHGKSVAVVISREAFDRLPHADGSLADLMRRSPLYGIDNVEFQLDKSLTRKEAL